MSDNLKDGLTDSHKQKSCWLFHDWGNWEVIKDGVLTIDGKSVGRYLYQQRWCKPLQ